MDTESPAKTKLSTERAAHRLEIAARRRQISQLLLTRVPQRDIARMLGVSTGTVSHDMKMLRAEWQQEAQVALEDHIAQELASYNADELYWRGEMAARGSDVELRLKVYDRILRIMESRRKLLGLEAPIRLELARAEAKKLAEEFGLDPDELLRMAEEILLENR